MILLRLARRRMRQLMRAQRNYLWCIIDGLFIQLGMNLSHPSLVLSVLVRALGGSNTLVGLLSTVRFSGWLLPQFLFSGWVQSLPRKIPMATMISAARAVIYGLLAVSVLFLGDSRPALMLLLLFILFGLSRVIIGVSALARTEVFGKIIPAGRRASFFATRNFWGGLFVFLGGFLVQFLLDPGRGLRFPRNFALLLFLSTGAFALALLAFSRVREEPDDDRPHYSVAEQFSRVPHLLRGDPILRRYLVIRLLLNMTAVVLPFYPVFALDVLHAPEAMVGFYLSTMTISAVVSNPLWRRVDRRRSTRSLLQTASLLTALVPLLAAGLPWAMRQLDFTVERYGLLPAYLFGAVFVLAGFSNGARGASLPAFVLEIAPDEERASYVGLVNTFLGFVNFLPIGAGAIIDQVGFEPVFLVATVLLFFGYLATLRLPAVQSATS
jgi:MFS family permease